MGACFAILSSHDGPDSQKQSAAEKHVLDAVWLIFLLLRGSDFLYFMRLVELIILYALY